jgi:hypothetical protein
LIVAFFCSRLARIARRPGIMLIGNPRRGMALVAWSRYKQALQDLFQAIATFQEAKQEAAGLEPLDALAAEAPIEHAVHGLLFAAAQFQRFYCPANERPRVLPQRVQETKGALLGMADHPEFFQKTAWARDLPLLIQTEDGTEPDQPFAIPPPNACWG